MMEPLQILSKASQVHRKKVIEDLEKNGLGPGPLTLEIACTKCDSIFELNKEYLAFAILMEISLLEYIRAIQSGNCPNCGTKSNHIADVPKKVE